MITLLQIQWRGLSPLARGNLGWICVHLFAPGPIPARAGEPRLDYFVDVSSGAYPRSRGGTIDFARQRFFFMGLSPLARGNQIQFADPLDELGPIPARAGEPNILSVCLVH